MDAKEKDGIKIVNIIFAVMIVIALAIIGIMFVNGNKTFKESTDQVEANTEEMLENEELPTESAISYTMEDEISLHREGIESMVEEPTGDYMFPDSDSRMLTRDELINKTAQELKIARNEIYARHGREFTDETMQNYFLEKDWYTPLYTPEEFDAEGDDWFNDYEYANKTLITEIEEELGYK